MYVSKIKNLYISQNAFAGKTNINSVNCSNIAWLNNSMDNGFRNCTGLSSVTGINQNVTSMIGTFSGCSNISYLPSIPSNVTSLNYTFSNCTKVNYVYSIPNTISSMVGTFSGCINLQSITTELPNTVTNMSETFADCTNLTNFILIKSTEITNAANCFANTTLTKNVFIPYTYDNGVYTNTYNAFINAGYKEDGSVCGVTLAPSIMTATINVDENATLYVREL